VAGFLEAGAGGAGDCVRGVVMVLSFCGGPLAQADFAGSMTVLSFFDAVAALLILKREDQQGQEGWGEI
jgi:hypothetical protein